MEAGFRRRGLGADSGVGDLGGVEETGPVRASDGTDEHIVGDASDEVADVFRAGEQRHGGAEGLLSVEGSTVIAFALFFCILVSTRIGFAAAYDGGVGGDGSGFALRFWSGFGHAGFSLGGLDLTAFLHCAGREGNFLQTTCGATD